MGRQKHTVAEGHRKPLPSNVKTSWLPAGYSAESVLAGELWKPAIGDVRVMELTGFQEKTGNIEGKETTFLLITAFDLQTGEEFAFVPGGLFQHLMQKDVLKTGSRVGVKYKGTKRMKNGFMANDWEIATLK